MTRITLARVRERLGQHTPERHQGPQSIQAAVAIILAPGDAGQLELLLIKRAEHPGDPWSGQMALPGGRRDPTDPDLLATARRETEEEVGIALRAQWLLGQLDDSHPRTRTLPPVVVTPFVFGLDARPAVRTSNEVALHLWVPLDELAGGQTRTEITIPDRKKPFPGYRVGEHVVWGITERILTPFIALLR